MIYHKRQIIQKCEKKTEKKERKAKDNYEKDANYKKRGENGKDADNDLECCKNEKDEKLLKYSKKYKL